ncbi:hypothetical protein Alg130_11313 [Pyrenophora tritici-repentis]|nr:hypothetical protein Alg130_11313 [Pyrenophora tritici-repentis]
MMSNSSIFSDHTSPEATPSPPRTGIRTGMSRADSNPLDSSPTTSRMAFQSFGMIDTNDEIAQGNSHGGTILSEETTQTDRNIPVSRYTDLGLNRVPARPTGRSAAQVGKLTTHAQPMRDKSQYSKLCTHPVPEDEDLAELEGMMVPEEPPLFVHNVGLGWQLINHNSGLTSGIKEDNIQAHTPSDGNHSATIVRPDDEDSGEMSESWLYNGTQSSSSPHPVTPWLHDKYFDPYTYLRHIDSEETKAKEVSKMEKLPKKQGQTKHAANTESLPVQTDMRNSTLSFNSSNTSDMPKRAETQKDPEQAISVPEMENDESTSD